MPYLITVSGERIALQRNRSYVIGRGRECELIVQDVACSRRHAKIIVAGSGNAAFLEDMGSRNGTYLNGDPIEGRAKLTDCDRIRVGTTLFLVKLKDQTSTATGRLDETGTIAFENLLLGDAADEGILRVVRSRAPATTDFAGQLASFGVVEVLQMLTNTHRSGTLNIALPDGHGTVDVRQGEVHHATYKEQSGFKALVRLGKQKNGIFWLVESSAPCPRTITDASARLLVELCRALDETSSAVPANDAE